MQQPVHLYVLELSTVNTHQYAKRHHMMILVTVLVKHDSFTAANTNSAQFKRSALLVCTTDEWLQVSTHRQQHALRNSVRLVSRRTSDNILS